MVYVEVFGIGDRSDEGLVLLGGIGWDGSRWVVEPEGSEIGHLLEQPVLGFGPDNPEAFLDALHRQYRSPHLRVGPVQSGQNMVDLSGGRGLSGLSGYTGSSR